MRPQFHFTAESGWINDPHGVTYRDGLFHVFYQYVPDSLAWAPSCHWGHATSPDLISFEQLPVAIAPGDGDDGIWTGSLVIDPAGDATIFYTSVTTPDFGIGRVRTAYPLDGSWVAWRKGSVVVEAPPTLDLIAYRDPYVFPEADGWRMLVGAATADGSAAALSYSSPDLREWGYDGVAAQRSVTEVEPVWSGALWECPQLFQLDGRHVMVTSVWDADVLHYVVYSVGAYEDGVFTPQNWGRLTYGDSYYAPTLYRDADDAPGLIFWLRGIEDRDEGWVGAHSVPHALRLVDDVLTASPSSAIDAYHSTARESGDSGPAADVVWTPGRHLRLLSNGFVVATIEVANHLLQLTIGDQIWRMPYTGGPVRLIADGPILEISHRSGLLASPIRPLGDSLTVDAEGSHEVTRLSR